MRTKLILLFVFCVICLSWASAQTITVTGVVISEEDNQPVVGASILVKGTTLGTITDIDGRFNIANVPASAENLQISYVGMLTREVKVQANLTIYLKSDSQLIDEVVVVAYGTAKRSSLTGAISTVNSDKISTRPVSDVSAALEGTTTGVLVNSSYGEPGVGSTVRIRGVNSINGQNDPLYVLDGAIYSGNVNDLNPNDIESISVLKDAASAALYGNRAANGVILITTKSGRSDKTRVNLNVKQGIYKRGMQDYERLNANEWMETMWAGYRNSLMSSSPENYPTYELANQQASKTLVSDVINYNIYNVGDTELFDENGKLASGVKIHDKIAKDLDWYKPLERLGHRQDYNLSVDNSTDKANYYFSLGYLDEKGYMKRSDFERYTARASMNVTPVKWLKLGMTLSGSHQKMNRVSGDPDDTSNYNTTFSNPFYFARNMAPIYPVHLFDLETGEYILDANNNIQYDNGNTYSRSQAPSRHIVWESELNKDPVIRNTLLGQTFADIRFLDFTFTLKGDMNLRDQEGKAYRNAIIGDGSGDNGRFNITTYRYKTYTFQQQLAWQKLINDTHFVDVLVGHENYSYNRAYRYSYKVGQAVEENYEFSNFSTLSTINGYSYDYKTESYLSRIRYNYNEKYYLEGSFRRDGSSRFAKDNRWGNFWSLGGSWMISEEEFMKPASNVINSLKLRASYGEVGNDQGVGYYGYMALMILEKNGGKGAVWKTQNEALDIKWETSQSIGVALEGRLFQRVNFSAEYFDKRSKDQLFDMYLPLSAGSTSVTNAESTITKNIGTISNRGFELSLDVDVIRNKDWKWNVGTNLTVQKNKVVSLPDENQDGIIKGVQKIMEGHGRYEFWTYQWVGVDQMTGNSLYRPAGGAEGSSAIPDEYLVNINGDYYTTNTTYAERDWCGTATPKVYGSVFTSLGWKNFTLSLLCTYSAGNKVYDYSYSSLMGVIASPSAIHKDVLKSWSGIPEGMTETSPNRIDPKGIPVVNHTLSTFNNAASSRFLHNGSYFSIKNISLSYSLPRAIANRMSLGGASLTCSMENLALFTALKGLNPQQRADGLLYNAYMPSKVLSLGLNVTL